MECETGELVVGGPEAMELAMEQDKATLNLSCVEWLFEVGELMSVFAWTDRSVGVVVFLNKKINK